MAPIPLKPLPRSSEPQLPQPSRKRSILGRAWRGIGWLAATPRAWLAPEAIRDGGALISGLAGRLRVRPRRDPRFHTQEEGAFDVRATAFSYGISVAEFERRLAARRRQTALTAYVLGMLGVVFCGACLLRVLAAGHYGARVLLAIEFLPVCLMFLLLAFYQALINFQIRVGRSASWRDYLMTDAGFWPRP